MERDDSEFGRELRRHQSLDHGQCEEIAARYGKSVRAVIAKAVSSGVIYLPRGEKGLSRKKHAENEARSAEIEALHQRIAQSEAVEGSQPFTTGIFHPLAFPLLMLVLLIAGIAALVSD